MIAHGSAEFVFAGSADIGTAVGDEIGLIEVVDRPGKTRKYYLNVCQARRQSETNLAQSSTDRDISEKSDFVLLAT